MHDDEKVKGYFHREAEDFDNIYDSKKGPVKDWLNKVLRKDMYRRFDVVMERLGNMEGESMLDIGCGSGRFSHAAATQGAERILGVDFAENMISLAKNIADEHNLSACTFEACDFMNMKLEDKSFDHSIAIGVFDYVKDPVPILKEMNRITKGAVYTSFPVKWVVRAPIRKLRLALYNCPCYFFTEGNLKRIFDASGTKNWNIIYKNQIYVIESFPR